MRRHDLTNKKDNDNDKHGGHMTWWTTKTNTIKKTNTMTIAKKNPQRTTSETCGLCDAGYISDNWEKNLNIHSDPWIKSDRDSIRNSCDVCVAITVFSQCSLAMSLRDKQKYSLIIHGIHFGRKGKKSALTIILWDNLVPRSDVNVLNHLVLENDL